MSAALKSSAAHGAHREWWLFTYDVVVELAEQQEYFVADDIEQIRLERDGPVAYDNRQLGPLLQQAEKDGICEPVEQWRRSTQRINHGRPMRVWRSLIFCGKAA